MPGPGPLEGVVVQVASLRDSDAESASAPWQTGSPSPAPSLRPLSLSISLGVHLHLLPPGFGDVLGPEPRGAPTALAALQVLLDARGHDTVPCVEVWDGPPPRNTSTSGTSATLPAGVFTGRIPRPRASTLLQLVCTKEDVAGSARGMIAHFKLRDHDPSGQDSGDSEGIASSGSRAGVVPIARLVLQLPMPTGNSTIQVAQAGPAIASHGGDSESPDNLNGAQAATGSGFESGRSLWARASLRDWLDREHIVLTAATAQQL
jgi:hypothetical protein